MSGTNSDALLTKHNKRALRPWQEVNAPILQVLIARPCLLVVTVLWSTMALVLSTAWSFLNLPVIETKKQHSRPNPHRIRSNTTARLSPKPIQQEVTTTQHVKQPFVSGKATVNGSGSSIGRVDFIHTTATIHLARVKKLFERTGYQSHDLDEVTESDETISQASATVGSSSGIGLDNIRDEGYEGEERVQHRQEDSSTLPDLIGAREHQESDSDTSEAQTLIDFEQTSSSSSSSKPGNSKSTSFLRVFGIRRASQDSYITSGQSTPTSRSGSPSPQSLEQQTSSTSTKDKICKNLCPSKSLRKRNNGTSTSKRPSLNSSHSDSSLQRRNSLPTSSSTTSETPMDKVSKKLSRSYTTSNATTTTMTPKLNLKKPFRSLSPLSRSPVSSPLPSPPPSPVMRSSSTAQTRTSGVIDGTGQSNLTLGDLVL